jgi:hypothetical protein
MLGGGVIGDGDKVQIVPYVNDVFAHIITKLRDDSCSDFRFNSFYTCNVIGINIVAYGP